jgi:hypothetical protein
MSTTDLTAKSKEQSGMAAVECKDLVELHLYEYQALTNRITYLVTMLYALWPLVFGALAFVASLWGNHRHAVVEWTGLLLGEILALAFYFTSCEISTHVCYLETELKPRLAKITADSAFWRWEPWLATFRGGQHVRGGGLQWWELWPFICTAIGVCAVAFIQWPWSLGDGVGFTVACAGLVFILILSIRLKRIQGQYSSERGTEKCE